MRDLLVGIEAFACVDAGFALIQVVLLQHLGQLAVEGGGICGVRVVHNDIVGGGDAHDIEDSEGAKGCTGGEHPGLVDGLHVGNSVGQQLLGGHQEGYQHGVEDVAGLLLLELHGDHAHAPGELRHSLIGLGIGAGMAHDLCNVLLPDVIGEVEGQKLAGPPGGVCQNAGQQGGGVGGDDGFLRQQGLKLGEECLLGLGLLGQGFDYQIGIGNRCGQVSFIVEVFKGFVGLTEQSVIVCGGGIPVEDQPTAYGTAMLLCGRS